MSAVISNCNKSTLAALALGLSAMAGSASAAEIICGETYTIQRGDTLSRIARVVYGSSNDFQIIYSANAAIIGDNPAIISVGQRLDLPCLGSASASTADSSAITQVNTTEALPAPDDRQIRFVVGSDWAPFTHENLEQGGMATEIANVAMARADGNPDYKIDFIKDWGAHLQPLISDHAYDFSLVWFRPNCDVIEKLSEDSKFRCNNLKWSDPVFEQLFGYYTRAGEPALTTYKDLYGKTVCRPTGYSTFMMEEKDLVEPFISLGRPNVVADCFRGLVDGTYDAVALATDTAEGAITEIGANAQVFYNEPLSQVLTMHAVISYNHPHADAYLGTLNSGLKKIKTNGEWFTIVQRHLSAFRAKNNS